MLNVSKLNNTVGRAIMQQLCPDTRNLSTFITMVISIVTARNAQLSAWISWLPENIKSGSRIRRLTRWLGNSSIEPHAWYATIFRYAVREWTQMPIYLVLDTSMLYDRFCCVRISMIYINRAIPTTWCVLEHNSSTVKYAQYAYLLERVVELLPREADVFFLADRGFVCKDLMRYLQQLKWTLRIRVKGNQKLQTVKGFITPKMLPLSMGKVLLFSRNMNFGKGLERISLSAGWAKGSQEPWLNTALQIRHLGR